MDSGKISPSRSTSIQSLIPAFSIDGFNSLYGNFHEQNQIQIIAENILSTEDDKILLNDDMGKLIGFLSLAKKPWESEILGYNVGSISQLLALPLNEDEMIAIKIRLLDKAGIIPNSSSYNLIYCRIDHNDQTSRNALAEFDFYLIEEFLTMKHDLQDIPSMTINRLKTVSTGNEISQVGDLAAHSFTYDRYHSDPNINDNIANDTRRKWAVNLCKGRSIITLISLENSTITGFAGLVERKIGGIKYGVLELIAVRPDYRGKGFGKELVVGILRECKRKYPFLLVSTQKKNISSHRLYENCGFKTVRKYQTFHQFNSKISE